MNGRLMSSVVLVWPLFAIFAACGGGGGGGGASPSGAVDFAATFPVSGQFRSPQDPVEGFSDDGKWWVEEKAPGRAVVVDVGRDGSGGLRLHTEPGDTDVSGSGALERNDVALVTDTDGVQGREQWWAHSILFPDDFAVTPADFPDARTVVFDFHDTRNQGGQANFHVLVEPGGLLTFKGFAGPTVITDDVGNQFNYGADIGQLSKNVWYDFVYHVKWSSDSDGFMQAWVNGVKKLDHHGPTLYQGYGVYLKLANYHTAIGQASSVIHDRVMRGTTSQAVSLSPLQGAAQ